MLNTGKNNEKRSKAKGPHKSPGDHRGGGVPAVAAGGDEEQAAGVRQAHALHLRGEAEQHYGMVPLLPPININI